MPHENIGIQHLDEIKQNRKTLDKLNYERKGNN